VTLINTIYIEGRGAVGVCATDSELFVIQSESNTVSVYGNRPLFVFQRSLVVEGMTDPTDILAGRYNQRDCLYIIDRAYETNTTHGCMLRTDTKTTPNTLPCVIYPPDVRDSWRPSTMSFIAGNLDDDQSGEILITTDRKEVYIYNINNEVWRTLILPASVSRAYHLVQDPSESTGNVYVLCQSGSPGLSRLLERDNCLQFLPSQLLDPTSPVKSPRYAIFAGLNLVVADWENNKISAVSCDLKRFDDLDTRSESTVQRAAIDRPCRLHLSHSYDLSQDQITCMLFVAAHHHIIIYEMVCSGHMGEVRNRPT
jgi:hypothetical protein